MKSDYQMVGSEVQVGDEVLYKIGHRFTERNMAPCKVIEIYPDTDEIRAYFRSGSMRDARANFYKKM